MSPQCFRSHCLQRKMFRSHCLQKRMLETPYPNLLLNQAKYEEIGYAKGGALHAILVMMHLELCMQSMKYEYVTWIFLRILNINYFLFYFLILKLK